jgi:tetratricopeptide (TPR) repeat protein/tRNA A-37 threonylcarbamoyl transferase component Bud32
MDGIPDTHWADLDVEWRQRVEELFDAALALPPQERSAFVRAQLRGQHTLQAELEELLATYESQEEAGGWKEPVLDVEEFGNPLIGRTIGAWRLERLLGEGGMGAVYLASRRDEQFEQTAALKLMAYRLANTPLQERFRQERQILARLSHPNIARLIDGGTTDEGDPYLVMDYVEGTPLDQYFERSRPPVRERLQLFLTICSAVHYAHQNLIVHRDLKPDNILVLEDGTPKLLDFGTAKLVREHIEPKVTQKDFRAFTPAYASPEEILGNPVTTASDTYSLGVILYRILTGVHPYEFQDYTTGELIRVICQQEPARPSARSRNGNEVSGDLDAIVLKAMRKEPGERYSSVDQLADDIRRFLEGRPVQARRGNFRYRAAKFVRRNWLAVAAASVVLVTLIGGVSGMLWQAKKAQARYHDLRTLTNSLLSEMYEVVQQLPGSTGAQRLLVTTAIEHLDRLSREVKDDRPLQDDLVEAYLKLGNLQGNPYEANIGDMEGGLKSLDKALSIAKELGRGQPDYTGVGRVEKSIGEILFGMGKPQEAVVHTRRACSLLEAQAQRPGAPLMRFYEAASCYDTLGDQYGQTGVASLGDLPAARASYEKAISLNLRALDVDPKFIRSRRALAINRMKVAQMVVEANPQEAVNILRGGLEILESLPAEEKQKIENRRARATFARRIAGALQLSGDVDASIEQYQGALMFIEAIAAVDPQNSRAQFDLAVILNDLSQTHEQKGDTDQALKYALRVREVLGRVLAKDPQNDVFRGHMADLLVRISGLMNGNSQEAQQLARSGIAVIKELAERPNAQPLDWNRAAQALSVVQFPSLRDPELAIRYAKRCVEKSGGKSPEYLHSLAVAQRAGGDKAAARRTALQGLALLPPTPQGGRPHSIRTRLEEEAKSSETRPSPAASLRPAEHTP